MRHLPATGNERVLVGFGTSDDAGVYRLRDDLAIVQTVDFFTPIVDDPFDFGRIAAANALSDIYAMGATPITALNIATFPTDAIELRVLERILEGGSAIALQAGVAILGGHTIKDNEPKYGMAVTGIIDPRRILTNAGARPGDVLILTKPIGTGIFATALKRGEIGAAQMQPAVDAMATLNDRAAAAALRAEVHAVTDVTGFGLLGHAYEMASASGCAIAIDARAVPFFEGALALIGRDAVPGGTLDNAAQHAVFTTFEPGVSPAIRLGLSDAQTSGGLLLSVPRSRADRLRHDLRADGVLDAVIGEVREGDGILVR